MLAPVGRMALTSYLMHCGGTAVDYGYTFSLHGRRGGTEEGMTAHG
jgi:uncharacterized membrane protein YeiB